MRTGLLALTFFALPALAGGPTDPIWRNREDARNLDCKRISQEEAHALYPDRVPEPASRTIAGDTRDVLACKRRYIRLGERPARDELILTSLRETTSDVARAAVAQLPEGKTATWHVDAFYPQMEVAAKLATATRVELAERGHRVSDRVPLLAAGDIAVLWKLPPKDAYPTACKRWRAEGALKDGDAFVGLMIVDPRESQVHAGVCLNGEWKWIR